MGDETKRLWWTVSKDYPEDSGFKVVEAADEAEAKRLGSEWLAGDEAHVFLVSADAVNALLDKKNDADERLASILRVLQAPVSP